MQALITTHHKGLIDQLHTMVWQEDVTNFQRWCDRFPLTFNDGARELPSLSDVVNTFIHVCCWCARDSHSFNDGVRKIYVLSTKVR